jgi:two-component system, cell cycle sensor histidine kinase and response regulator CckA
MPPPQRILLVEDDDAYADLVTAQLATAGVPVEVARVHSLAEARQRLPELPVDVILLDLGLPDSSGLRSLARMREVAGDIPIVVLTGHDSDAEAVAAVQAGADDYLIKSSTDAQLLSRAVRYACERAAIRLALRRSEEQLRQSQKMEAVGRLAGGVAHDFNNVLTAIFGYADLLLDQFTPEDPRRADLEEIRRSAERAATLTRQLLALSRKQLLQPRVVDLNEIVGSLEKLLGRLMGDRIELVFRPAADLWKVKADPGQIEQVLVILCANARDAMPERGRLEITTFNEEISQDAAVRRDGLPPGAYAVLRVSEAGHGMPQEIRQHVFEPFFTTKEHGKGTGLGLSTAYGIVKQSGGGIYVESEEGVGSNFSIYLPCAAQT